MATDWHYRNWHGVDRFSFCLYIFFSGVWERLRTTDFPPIEAARIIRAQRRQYVDEGADLGFYGACCTHNID